MTLPSLIAESFFVCKILFTVTINLLTAREEWCIDHSPKKSYPGLVEKKRFRHSKKVNKSYQTKGYSVCPIPTINLRYHYKPYYLQQFAHMVTLDYEKSIECF